MVLTILMDGDSYEDDDFDNGERMKGWRGVAMVNVCWWFLSQHAFNSCEHERLPSVVTWLSLCQGFWPQRLDGSISPGGPTLGKHVWKHVSLGKHFIVWFRDLIQTSSCISEVSAHCNCAPNCTFQVPCEINRGMTRSICPRHTVQIWTGTRERVNVTHNRRSSITGTRRSLYKMSVVHIWKIWTKNIVEYIQNVHGSKRFLQVSISLSLLKVLHYGVGQRPFDVRNCARRFASNLSAATSKQSVVTGKTQNAKKWIEWIEWAPDLLINRK